MAQFKLSDARIRINVARPIDGQTIKVTIECPDVADIERRLLSLIHHFLIGATLPEPSPVLTEGQEAR